MHTRGIPEVVQREQQLRLKRVFDVLASAAGLTAVAPVLAVAAVAVRATMGAPVFFRQQRPGLHGEPFSIWKFRTMTDERGADGQLLPDEERLTRIGKFIRQTSIDELPQLLNVLRGEMSLVGPRPLLMRYLNRYSERQAHRHDMKPGITGLAQTHGRTDLPYGEMMAYDLEYVDHHPFRRDLEIMLQTAGVVARREGAR